MPTEPRELRRFVAVEGLALAALVVAPLPYTVPIALPLLVVATLSRWIRGRGWREVAHSPGVMLGGAIAGLVAVAIAAPLFGAFDVTAVEWWLVPALRAGDPTQLAFAFAHSIVVAVALELALRGWVLERAWELSPGPPTLPIAATAAIEALLLEGPIASRIGAAMFGAGLGLLYVAAGRTVLASIAARAVFVTGATAFEAFSAG